MENALPIGNVPLPHRLKIELTTHCNLACRFCGRGMAVDQKARQLGLTEERQVMRLNRSVGEHFDLEVFKALIEGLPELEEVDLQGVGEPLIHPYIISIITWLAARSIRVTFTTNGSLLTHTTASKLLSSGNIRQISVSLDTPVANVYAFLRRGGRAKTVIDNITFFMRLRATMQKTLPRMRIVATLSKQNLGDLISLLQVAKDTGVDAIGLSMLKEVDGTLHDWLLSPEEARESIKQAHEYAQKIGIALEDETGILVSTENNGVAFTTHSICNWPWTSAMVT